ncbi:MAG: MFS transporter, partial [Erysipelotrichaceae bacterium]
GLGAGAVDSALNAYAAHHLENKHMNWLHACWGIGATLSPLLITFGVVQLHSWRAGWAIIAVLLGLLSFVLYLNLGMWKTPYKVHQKQSEVALIAKRSGFTIVLSVLTYVIYVAMEGGLGLWLSALLIESRGLSVGIAGVMVSSYFGSITLGRIGVGLIAHKFTNRTLVRSGLLVAGVGSVLLLQQTQTSLYALGIVLIGLGFAPIYPSLMHETAARYPQAQATKVIGYQVSFSYIATLLVTPLMGIVATATTLEVIPWIVVVELSALCLVVIRLDQIT